MVNSDIIVGLDIGTSRICVVIGEYTEEGKLRIAGFGAVESCGIRKGVVVNIEAAQKAIASAIEIAEQKAGRTVGDVYTAVTGGNIEGLNSRGVVAISGKSLEVTQFDIDKVLEAARAIAVPMDREILHVIPQQFMIDDKVGIKSPIDMIGVRLEADVHIITGSISATQNIIKCINRCGNRVKEISLESLVASEAVLSEQEKDLGVLYLDMGAGTTDAIIFKEGAPCYTFSLPLGGEQVTKDIGVVLKQNFEEAEQLKLAKGQCWEPLVNPGGAFLLAGPGGHNPQEVSEVELCRIVESRLAEMLMIIKNQIVQSGYLGVLQTGIVVSGGVSLTPGLLELLTDIFKVPSRIGQPSGIIDLPKDCHSPRWSTAIGLILSVYNGQDHYILDKNTKKKSAPGQSWLDRIKSWLKNFV